MLNKTLYNNKTRVILCIVFSVILVACVIVAIFLGMPAKAMAATNGVFTFTDNSTTTGKLDISISGGSHSNDSGHTGYASTSVTISLNGTTIYTESSEWTLSGVQNGSEHLLSVAKDRYSIDVIALLNSGKLTAGKTYTLTCSATGFIEVVMGTTVGLSPAMAETGTFSFTLQTISDLPPTPTKTGYTFTGWYTDAACTHQYTDTKVVGNITLYAGWRANTYSVKFNANGGSGTMLNESFTYDAAKALTANAFTKTNYKFKGWATSASGNVVYTDKQSVKNLTATNGGTVNLYAVWELNSYTVQFVSDGTSISTQTVNIGSTATAPANPVKTGYTFVGWFYSNGTQYKATDTFASDTTLTAKFEIIKCVVTFIVDGEVYGYYECDYGTNLQTLLSENIDTAAYMMEDEYSENF